MNIIKELALKYSGTYSEESAKDISTPLGKYFYQPKNGTIFIDGTKITVNIKEVGGAIPVAEPFRITLHLKNTYEGEFAIYPKGLIHRILDSFVHSKNITGAKQIFEQFRLNGNESLLNQLLLDEEFINNIIHEKVYIVTEKKRTNMIILTPKHGISSLIQFEKYIVILKLIEQKLVNHT